MFGETDYDPGRTYASIPLEEQLEALACAQRAGQIRHFGLSNETAWGVMEACRLGAWCLFWQVYFLPKHESALSGYAR